ncbi:unnamed protein product [Arabidopsis lyrata]|uniref:Uncharacterized protein n=1 Tax=Arabidopsis lyrata subsp. lyrata TaxID=81972 RepID=D7MBD1_ARALL|nr:hypothetical protein ARALYDRAFT_915369 [Arabidopsis lyrata subsp. lyrata]CAH8276660.1 unnamed protein product [Arabidopsis lyrata]
MAGDGEISCSLFYGRRGNALFSRSWLPIPANLDSQFVKQLNSSNLGVYAMDWIGMKTKYCSFHYSYWIDC